MLDQKDIKEVDWSPVRIQIKLQIQFYIHSSVSFPTYSPGQAMIENSRLQQWQPLMMTALPSIG